MRSYIVNPPIVDDLDYYRFDDSVVERILGGDSILSVGLRRSGKTSFLRRVERAARRSLCSVRMYELGDILQAPSGESEFDGLLTELNDAPESIILLDEVEVCSKSQMNSLSRIFLTAKHTVAMTCAPSFAMELDSYPDDTQRFIDNCDRHIIGPLSKEEAESLLRQSKRGNEISLSEDVILGILGSNERFPIVLQAFGRMYAEGIDLVVSLAGLGSRILAGLTDTMRSSLLRIASGEDIEVSIHEATLLISLGALKADSLKADSNRRLEIATETLKNFLLQSKYYTGTSTASTKLSSTDRWSTKARILHLSDLHFGPKCIEDKLSAEVQVLRLTRALERFGIVPDFVAVTGDLSWSGNRREFALAETFLEGVSKWLAEQRGWSDELAKLRFLLVPGNHDAAWALTTGLKAEEEDDFVMFGSAAYANSVNRFYGGALFWDMEKPCLTRQFAEYSIAFVLASTAHRITSTNRKGQIGEILRAQIIDALCQKDVQGSLFRLGLIHHNLTPFHDAGECLLDSRAIGVELASCRPGLDLILHGHVHQGEVDFFHPRRGLPPIPYSCVGSFGVQAEYRPGDDKRGRTPNEFSVIDLEVSSSARRFSTQFFFHEYTPTGKWEWTNLRKDGPFNLE
jgi:hypothetical protein